MSLSSSLNAGVAGLSVNATRLAVISDNIANSSTNGYRRADVEFSSLVIPSGPNSTISIAIRARSGRFPPRSGPGAARSSCALSNAT